MKKLIALFLLAEVCLAGNSYHVTVNGSPSGSGTIASPLDARTAQLRTTWQPGDTVWIHGGTYTGNGWQFMASGTQSLPVVFRNWNNERAIFSDNVGNDIIGYDKGNDCWLWGLEFVSTVAVQNQAGVQMGGTRSKMINCYIHDTQTTGTTSQQSEGTEIYGTIFQYCGRFIPPPPASVSGGYSIYTQNIIGAGLKYVNDCILEWSYGPSLHVYTQGATISNMSFDGDIIFGSGYLWRANQTDQPAIERWEANFLAGSTGIPGDNLILTNNIFYHDRRYPYGKNFLTLYTNCTNATLKDNRFISPNNGIAIELDGSASVNSGNFILGGTNLPTGTNNTFLTAWPTTRANEIIIRPNKYEAGRANIVVLNWQGSSSVSINLSSVIPAGTQYRLVDAMNFYGTPVSSGTYAGGAITVSMAPGAVAQPLGNPAKSASETIDFRVFVLLASGAPQPPPPQPAPSGTFDVSPLSLVGSGQVTLSWTSVNATSALINGTAVGTSGSMVTTVGATTTFALTLNGSGGSTTYSRTVTVTQAPPPPPPTGVNCDTAYARGFAVGTAGIQAARDSAYQQGYLDGKASMPPPIILSWDSVSYTYVNGQSFPAASVVLPKGAVVLSRSYNAVSQTVLLYYLKPKLTP